MSANNSPKSADNTNVTKRTPSKSSTNTLMLVEGGLVIAMAQILSMYVIYQMPQGGAVKAANLVPLLIYAYRWGGRAGMLTGLVYGIVHFILGFKYSVHYLSIILDYLLAYGAIGIAGFFGGAGTVKAFFGAVYAALTRFAISAISGVVVFGAYAPEGQSPWVYSLLYNATYMLPDLIINLVILAVLYVPVMKGLRRVNTNHR